MLFRSSLLLGNWINTFGAMNFEGPDHSEKTKIDIILANGHDSNLRPRSEVPQPSITAELFADQLAFYFDDPVGEVVVTVTNSCGQVVSACTCNTDFEPMCPDRTGPTSKILQSKRTGNILTHM